ncbi:hypothetical protein ACFWNN_23935 [Lentzea sp. NPDC058450]|uniref:cysteine dioxygenase family protein n=1 Tax=Lentzea sp. NPDC058450 TaxID=3346505 RepID=UPI00365A142C
MNLQTFLDEVAATVAANDDEHVLTKQVADHLATLLTSGYRLPVELTRPDPDHHVNYPLHRTGTWCVAVVVWAPGQRTPVHGHETWGVVGIYSGAEREIRYAKPTTPGPLTALDEQTFPAGSVTVCCTTDDDVHAVEAASADPTIGIHVYGADIGTIRRRRYDPATGEVTWFTGGWHEPSPAALPRR